MLRTLMVSAAVSALMISGALAQANPPTNAPAAETHSAKFIQAQGTDKLVFSKFKGSDVLGPDDQKVGSVSDILFDKSGKIDGLIVGVGGFLGMGEPSVESKRNLSRRDGRKAVTERVEQAMGIPDRDAPKQRGSAEEQEWVRAVAHEQYAQRQR